jgi:hypothetical protein
MNSRIIGLVGIALLSQLSGAVAAKNQRDGTQFVVKVVDTRTGRPVESELSALKDGSWILLGQTQNGVFRSKSGCSAEVVIKARPLDSSFYGSGAVICAKLMTIPLRQRPMPTLASGTVGCDPAPKPALDRAKTQFLPITAMAVRSGPVAQKLASENSGLDRRNAKAGKSLKTPVFAKVRVTRWTMLRSEPTLCPIISSFSFEKGQIVEQTGATFGDFIEVKSGNITGWLLNEEFEFVDELPGSR